MDLIKTGIYMVLWTSAFVAVWSITNPVMQQVEDFIGGN